MPTANNPVKFVSTTYAKYKALTTKDSDTCYFCSDKCMFFIGDISYNTGVTYLNTTPTTEDVKNLPDKTLIIVKPNTANNNCFELYYLVEETITTIGKFENVANKSSKDVLQLMEEDTSYNPTTDNVHYFDGIAMASLIEKMQAAINTATSGLLGQSAIKETYNSTDSTIKLTYSINAIKAAIQDLSASKAYVDNKVTTYVNDKIGNIDTILDSINGE